MSSLKDMTAESELEISDGHVCPESTIESANRRSFIRRAVLLTAGAGIGGSILGRSAVIPESSASSTPVTTCTVNNAGTLAVWSTPSSVSDSCCLTSGIRVGGTTTSPLLTVSKSCSSGAVIVGSSGNAGCGASQGPGVQGDAACIGVLGQSLCSNCILSPGCGTGVKGTSGSGIGVLGEAIFGGTGLEGLAGSAFAIPIVAKGAASQSANLQQWEKSCGAPLSVVNKSGWLGIGAKSAPTTLRVNGSMSAKTVAVSANYAMKASDFAVLASGTITLTLPKAKIASGMIVFIKNTSTGTVTVGVSGTDTIEGFSSKLLKKQFDSLQLISNGTNEWFILGNSICAAFTS